MTPPGSLPGQLEPTLTGAIRAAHLLTCRGKGPLCVSEDQSEVPSFLLFSNHLAFFCFFLRVALGKGQGNVFTDLLDIWGVGISLEFTEDLAVNGILSPLGLHVHAGSCLLSSMQPTEHIMG